MNTWEQTNYAMSGIHLSEFQKSCTPTPMHEVATGQSIAVQMGRVLFSYSSREFSQRRKAM